MSRGTYEHSVVTEIPQETSQKARRVVVAEILKWCQDRCAGGFYVHTIDPEGGNTLIGRHLSVHFEKQSDAEAFGHTFAPDDVVL